MELSSTHLRYLYAIYEISQTLPDVRSSIVAARMEVSRPSVAKMLRVLMSKSLIKKEKYGKIHLTDKGLLITRNFDRKVTLLAKYLKGTSLKLTDKELHETACAIVAALPDKEF